MLFLRLAILSALSVLVALALFVSVGAAPSFVPAADNADAFFAFSRAAEVLFARLVVLVGLTDPLSVRLCKDGSEPSGFSNSFVANAGTDEWRRALRATLASSVRGRAGSAEDSSLKSKMARLFFSTNSSLTAGCGALGSAVSSMRSSAVFATKFDEVLRCVVLVCSINAEMAFDVVDWLVCVDSGGVAFSLLSSFWRNGLPAPASSSPVSCLIVTLPVESGANFISTLVL